MLRSSVLDERSCWDMLRTRDVGRLNFTQALMPVIRPVPFAVDRSSVVVVMGLTALLPETFAKPAIVAFEAGEWTPGTRGGWSVQLVGNAQTLPEPEKTRLVEQGLTSWIDGEPGLYVRVTDGVVIGQRVSE